MTHMRGMGLLGLALGMWMVIASDTDAQGGGESGIPDDIFKKLVDKAVAEAEEGVRDWKDTKIKEKERKEHYRKARGAAAMIAAYAQMSMTNANAMERASLRDAALKLATQLEKDQVDAAKKTIAEIKGGVKPNPKADPKPVAIMPKYAKIEEVMKQFSSKPGGTQLEAKLIQNILANKKNEKAKEVPAKNLADPEYPLMIYQSIAIAELIKDHPAQKKEGKGPAEWKEYTAEQRKESQELLKIVTSSKDGKAAWKVLSRLDQACYRCHKIWRDSD